ncbi:E3 ubiquitin-protein ligase RING1-like [Aristolochia californica]|uniref:E3 ubiquitin-protein ligase RING1-like n=1 Tax=Aristolochia californica TaxID=171875 RepID=UPI0035D793E0
MASSPAAVADESPNGICRTTYWCHECDMSVTLFSSSPPLLCPQCTGEFLEQMDLPNPNPNSSPNFSSLPPPLSSILDPFLSPQTLTLTDSESDSDAPFHTFDAPEDFFIDRLIHHLAEPDDDTDSDGDRYHRSGPCPTSPASIENIPTVKITTEFLNSHDSLLCAVCKDEFVLDVEAKELPCKHIYHCDCILPWLSQHNSCPVCRFRLPADESNRRSGRRAASGSRVSLRFGSLMDEDDLFGVGNTLRHIARRHQLVFPVRATAAVDSSQMAQAETSSAGPANSGETVSSWPVEGTNSVGGGGSGSARGRILDDEGDAVMSEARRGLLN